MKISHRESTRELFGFWMRVIRENDVLCKELRPINLKIVDDTTGKFTARVSPGESFDIEISAVFLDEIVQWVENSENSLMAACLKGLESERNHIEKRVVFDALSESVISFVLLHEIFHVLAGHIDRYCSDTSLGLFAFDETGQSLENDDPESAISSEHILQELYCCELEADNCAIQCLAQMPLPPHFLDFLTDVGPGEERHAELEEMEGASVVDVVMYRVLLISVWMMVKILEHKLGSRLAKRSKRHPYPGARILAAIASIMEEFCNLDLPASGPKTFTLDHHAVAQINLFIDQVMEPVLKQPWPLMFSDLAEAGVETFAPWVIKESFNLLFDKPVETTAGKDVRLLNKIRVDMVNSLSQYRYY